ncbi:MAG: DUF1802 family protein [Dehalococcoidia bacterium]|nr:DUF1802 family protein [Dehalococcoidia bacterium]MSQ17248.1 DUF1802 family protein [Dehalococcoidia bacterium]
MLPNRCQTALKEWAVTVDALGQGTQVLLMRKGGIHEEGKNFRVLYPEFLLYPTYEHQKLDLLKPSYQANLARTLAEPAPKDTITFSYWAKLAEVMEISQQEQVDRLSKHFIWTNAYAQSRLYWKPMLALSVMLLRVYRMEQPVTAPLLPEYPGCRSWVDILTDVPLGTLKPVLAEKEFQRRVDEVKGSLGLTVGAR